MLPYSSITPHQMGGLVATCLLLNKPMLFPPNSTLNQALNVLPSVFPTPTEKPVLKYFAISNKGLYATSPAPGINTTGEIPNAYTDTGMFNYVPFVLRETAEDLPAIERAKYRIRRLEDHGGVMYAAYYLKVIDTSTTEPSLNIRTLTGGSVEPIAYNPTLADLLPTPKTPTALVEAANVTSGQYAGNTAVLDLTLTESDVTEIINACTIIYGSPSAAVIAKIGLYSGYDRQITGSEDASGLARTEAIGCVLHCTVGTDEKLGPLRPRVPILFDAGTLEPLYNYEADS